MYKSIVRNYFGTPRCVLCGEVYCTLSILGRVHYWKSTVLPHLAYTTNGLVNLFRTVHALNIILLGITHMHMHA